jgi:methyl-accepting chemotaxis protein
MGSALAHMERLAALRRLSSRIREFRGEWERQPHKPVTQNNMSEGEIELF